MRDLDSLPMPAWDLVDMGAYRKRWLKSSGYFSLNVSTTRGCPFHCNWCAKPIYGNGYHAHSPQRVVQELKATTERQAAVIALQEGQIKALTAGLREQAEQIQKVSAQLEMVRPAPRVVENR